MHFFAAGLFFAAIFAFSCSGEKDGGCSVKPKKDAEGEYDVFCEGKRVGGLSNGNDCGIYEKSNPKDGYDIICNNELVGELSSCYVEEDGIYFVMRCGGVENARWLRAACGSIPYDPSKKACDDRDHKIYRYAEIGGKFWLAENMNYASGGSKCYNGEAGNCSVYGRLYDWEAARTACPAGWHLPDTTEWKALIAHVEGENSCSDCAGKFLKVASGWNAYQGVYGNGTDAYGFSALPAGGDFTPGFEGTWWNASQESAAYAYYYQMSYSHDKAGRASASKSSPFSVRCVMN
jgi:uncharacterized protein (TIGR02145 family)